MPGAVGDRWPRHEGTPPGRRRCRRGRHRHGGTARPGCQLDRVVDGAVSVALSAPVELGFGVHRHRTFVVRRAACPAGAGHPVRCPVGQRDGPPHRLQPSRAGRRVFPGARLLGYQPVRERSSRDPDVRHHPAAGPRVRGTRHAPARRGRWPAWRRRVTLPPFQAYGPRSSNTTTSRTSTVAALFGVGLGEVTLGTGVAGATLTRGAAEGVRPSVASLRLAAADVSARGAEAKVEGAATLLAAGATRGRALRGDVLAGRVAGTCEAAKDVHARNRTAVRRCRL